MVFYGLAFTKVYTVEDSRIQSGRWLAERLPHSSRVGLETGAFAMYNLVSQAHYQLVWLNIHWLFYGVPYRLCGERIDFLRQRVEQMDCLVLIDVNRADQFRAVPELFPAVADFYQKLYDGVLGLEPVRRFKVFPSLLDMHFADDGAEPSFLGYDHPSVLIFRRTKPAAMVRALDRWQNASQRSYGFIPTLVHQCLLNAAAEAILPHLTDCASRTTESDRWPKAEPETAVMPTEMEDYLFDQRDYLVLENALD